MTLIDERETQDQKRTEKNKADRSYSKRMRAK